MTETTVRRIISLLFSCCCSRLGHGRQTDRPSRARRSLPNPRYFARVPVRSTSRRRRFQCSLTADSCRTGPNELNDPVRAKCLVLDDGSTRLAIVVVDSCMMPRELLDRAKELAREKTGIPTDRILISATHTHSAPAAMGALGCPADANYVSLLPGRIAESIERATKLLEPARIGWNVIDDHEHTFCRRWIRRPDKMLDDPFGQRTVRANMHPGYQNPDAIAPAGPVDPALTVLSVQSRNGRPIAVLANYSMHYYGAEPVSADYFGRFGTALAKRIGAQAVDPPFVGIMSQGTSGDQMWMDYGQPKKEPGLDAYADAVARFAQQAYQSITYRDWVSLAMAETKLVLGRRVPDGPRLAWAKAIVGRMGNRDIPNSLPEVYAKEAIFLHEEPRRELKLQAIRIGELGIAAIPNEVFAHHGPEDQSPKPVRNDDEHRAGQWLGGLHPTPRAACARGLYDVAGSHRRAGGPGRAQDRRGRARVARTGRGQTATGSSVNHGPYARSVLASKPLAYWRLDEIQGPIAVDSSGHGHHARYEGGVAYYLPGRTPPASPPANRSTAPSISREAASRLSSRACRIPTASSSGSGTACRTMPVPITGVLVSLGVEKSRQITRR